MTSDTGDGTARTPRTALALIAFVGVMAASLLGMVVHVQGVSAAMVEQDARPDLTIERGSFSHDDLMAGDHVRQTVAATSNIDALYEMHASFTGSESMAAQMAVTITVVATGEILYDGPLAQAGFSGRRLSSAQPEELVIEVYLADAADAGLSVNVNWTYSAARLT